MDLLTVVLALAAHGVAPRPQESRPDPWPATWEALAAAERLDPGEDHVGALADLALALEELELSQGDDPRVAVLRAQLRRLEGGEASLHAFAPPSAWPTADEEAAWRAAELLAPGPARNRALALALAARAGAGEALSAARTRLAWDGWLEAAEALRFEEALAIGRPLHAEVRAGWSAHSLALCAHKAGATREADRVLAEQIDRGGDGAAGLWNQRGVLALGGGRRDSARYLLGRAVALGSADSRAVLARTRLDAGRAESALAGFSKALEEDPKHPWARRGWGLALLRVPPGVH